MCRFAGNRPILECQPKTPPLWCHDGAITDNWPNVASPKRQTGVFCDALHATRLPHRMKRRSLDLDQPYTKLHSCWHARLQESRSDRCDSAATPRVPLQTRRQVASSLCRRYRIDATMSPQWPIVRAAAVRTKFRRSERTAESILPLIGDGSPLIGLLVFELERELSRELNGCAA